jgi:hypothetical protein
MSIFFVHHRFCWLVRQIVLVSVVGLPAIPACLSSDPPVAMPKTMQVSMEDFLYFHGLALSSAASNRKRVRISGRFFNKVKKALNAKKIMNMNRHLNAPK